MESGKKAIHSGTVPDFYRFREQVIQLQSSIVKSKKSGFDAITEELIQFEVLKAASVYEQLGLTYRNHSMQTKEDMVALWNDDARLVLIDEIHKRPEMWDSRRERYAPTERKKEIYTEIADIINTSGACTSQMFTEDDVRNQWKNLKDTFKRKLKKRQTDVEAGLEDAEPTWRFWSKMLFIRHDCHNDSSTSATMNNMNVDAACANFDSYMNSLHSLVDKTLPEDRNNVIQENGGAGSDARMPSAQSIQNGYHCDGRDLPPNTSLHCPEEVDSLPSQSPLHQSTVTSLGRLKRKPVKRKACETDNDLNGFGSQLKHELEDEYTLFGKFLLYFLQCIIRSLTCYMDKLFFAGRSVASSLRRLAECAPIDSLRLKKQISDMMFETELQQLLRRQKVEPQ
uniref:MADF domain-containing protein n=1 Tax=Syphacia muris TaxID=451379 RepID=A0A0N5ALR6_9BILA